MWCEVPGFGEGALAFDGRSACLNQRLSVSWGVPNRYTRNFTRSEDALILRHPVTGIGLKTLSKMIRATPQTLIRRAGELGVSLAISDDYDEALDTRALRCTDGLVDPLLERLKQVHGER